MPMTAANEQIVALFEDNGISPEQIAGQFGYEVSAVKAILFQNSKLFRKEAKTNDAHKFSDQEAEEMRQIILGIARYSEDDTLRLKAATYVRDDHLGRKEIQSAQPGMQNLQLHITQIATTVEKALAAQARVVKALPVIDTAAITDVK